MQNMKLRISRKDHVRLGIAADAIGVTTDRMVYRCLRKWCAECVATVTNREPATCDSTVITLDTEAFSRWAPAEIRSAIRYSLDRITPPVPLKIDEADAATRPVVVEWQE